MSGRDLEQLEVQLAGCATAALGWNENPAKQGDYGWSPAYQDVLELRARHDDLLAALKALASLKEFEEGGCGACGATAPDVRLTSDLNREETLCEKCALGQARAAIETGGAHEGG